MTISKPIAFVGALAIVVAAAARLHASDEVVVPSWDAEDHMMAARDAAGDAEALRAVHQLKKETGGQTFDEAILRGALFFISLSTAVVGVALLGWRVLANRQRQFDRAEWTQHLLLLGQRRHDEPISSREDVEDVAVPTIRLIPGQYPKTGRRMRRMPAAMPIEPARQWKRAA